MTTFLIVARAALVAVFALAGTAKLADLAGARAALRGFGAPARIAGPLAVALPLAELALAAALVPAASARWAAPAALALLLLFAAAIARAIRAGAAPDCHCFGQLHSAPAGRATLLRNLLLAALAGGVAGGALADGAPSLVAWIGTPSSTALVALGAGALLALLLAAFAWFGIELLRQNGRLLERLDALERTLGSGADAAAGAHPAAAGDDDAPAAPLTIPDVVVTELDGAALPLAEAVDAEQPTLLVFSDPRCGPCRALLPQLAAWREQHAGQLAIALVSRGDAEENRPHAEEHGLERLLLDPDGGAADAFGVLGTPSAALVLPGGRVLAGPVPGADAIHALVAEHAPAPLLRVLQSGRG